MTATSIPTSGDTGPGRTAHSTSRLPVIDALRGLAILAMVAYHLSWDLSWFAYVDWQVSSAPEWRAFAAAIAGSFLFLSGVSLALAHGAGIRWRGFWKREAILVAAAAAVSLITYLNFGNSFVRFGILHCMALGSLIALPFTRLPVMAALLAALFVIGLEFSPVTSVFDGDLWLWTGLGIPDTGSVDYVPLVPWIGLIFLGIAVTRLLRPTLVWVALSLPTLSGPLGRGLVFLGRKSLIIYLVHQPLLYGTVWVISLMFGAPDRDALVFVEGCTTTCTDTYGDRASCEAACGCTQSTLADTGTWAKLVDDPSDPALRDVLNSTYAQCLRQTPPELTPPGN